MQQEGMQTVTMAKFTGQQELDGPGRMRGYRAMWYTHSIGLRNTGTKENGGRNLRK